MYELRISFPPSLLSSFPIIKPISPLTVHLPPSPSGTQLLARIPRTIHPKTYPHHKTAMPFSPQFCV